MSKAGQVAVVIFALVAFACGFLGAAVGLDVTQPANHHSNVVVQFHVLRGDTTNTVSTRLEKDGLIRNALLFRLLARFRKLDTQIEPGTYHLSPNMTMDVIIQTLLKGVPSELLIKVPPGLRVTQYPDPAYYVDGKGNPLPNFTDLPNFDATSFLKIVQTGVLPDGTKLSTKFWFVPPKQPNTVYALEGYLFPNTYYFDTAWNEGNVVDRLLEGLGEQLCPGGPDQDVTHAYYWVQSQCKAHAAQVGPNKNENIFTEMETKFNTTNDVMALYDTLTLASIVVREAGQNPSDIPGVADVYYNRYALAFAQPQYITPSGETIVSLEADPTAQYARDTDSPPNTSKGGKWWAPLTAAAKDVDPNNLYNTANPAHKGLPPGPIAAPLYDDIRFVAAADEPPKPYYYFIDDCHGKTWYAKTAAEQTANEQQHPVNPPCP